MSKVHSYFSIHINLTHANILTKKLINQFEIQIVHKQEICTFNVQTKNMAFNASTMWKNHHLALPTKKLVSFSLVPLNLHYDRFIIWRRNQIQANCTFYWAKLVPSKRSNFTKPWTWLLMHPQCERIITLSCQQRNLFLSALFHWIFIMIDSSFEDVIKSKPIAFSIG